MALGNTVSVHLCPAANLYCADPDWKGGQKAQCDGNLRFPDVFAALPFFLRLAGWFPENDSVWTYPLIWAHTMINVMVIVLFGAVQSSMLADIVEHSEMSTGRREEGLFFASRSFAQKATSGVGAFIAGIALDLISFPRNAPQGEVDPDVVWNLGFIFGPGIMLFYFLALWSISYYKITRVGHNDRVEVLRQDNTNEDAVKRALQEFKKRDPTG